MINSAIDFFLLPYMVSFLQTFGLKILLVPLEKYAIFLNYKIASPPQTTGREGPQTDEHMPVPVPVPLLVNF